MPVYKLSTARLEMWKAWLTLNEIPTREVVRDQRMTVAPGRVSLTEFVLGADGKRVIHTCECDGGVHLAKRVTTYDVHQMPAAWAEQDLVSA